MVEVEMAGAGGDWVPSAPGIWVWKYALDGFAIKDLWYQGADELPPYLAHLGRDYLLSASRIFDKSTGSWQVSWMANGAGTTMGADFGTFSAVAEDDGLIMTAPPAAFGQQRVIFHDISDDSFRWRSEYSMDAGTTWRAAMQMHATRYKP